MRVRIYKKRILLFCLAAMQLFLCACEGVVLNADAAPNAVCISEVMSANARTLTDETLGSPDWIELYNASADPVDLTGYGLSDNLKEPHKWTFPAITLEPGAFLLVYASKQKQDLCTGFGLSKSGELLYLSDAYYNMLQTLELPALEADVSYARNSAGEYGYCAVPTPGKANNDADIVLSMGDIVYASEGALRIAELLPRNASVIQSADGGYYPYVKLTNVSADAVSLASFYLSDDRADPAKWPLPDVTLAPGGFILVYLSGKDKSGDELHASFKLGRSDDTVFLSDPQGVICDSIHYDLAILDDVAVVQNDTYTAFPAPQGENDPRTFTGTALVPMDASDPVRLNEVLVRNRYSASDEDGDRDAWAELYNASLEAVSLQGYCLSDDAEKPFKWSFPADASIEPGGYLLIYLDGKDRAGAYLHTPFSLSVADGALLFTNKNGLRCDQATIDPAIGQNVSYGLDEAGQWAYFATPTPGAKNSAHAFASAQEVSITDMNGVYISEVSAASAAKSGKTDWIELHNASGRDVNLSGWHLSDDPDNLTLFTFPDTPLASGGYAALNASTRSGKQQEGVTAPFGISDGGELLILSDKDGEIRDVFETGVLHAGVSSGRDTQSAVRVFYAAPTKGEANASASAGCVMTPVLSDTALYYSAPFSLAVSCLTPGASIRYTTDGSKPTVESALYTGPVTISQNTIFKAAAFKEGMLPSEMAVSTFLFETPHTVPVVCLSIDSASFDEVYSVTDRWKKVEKEGYFEYYEADGRLGTEFPCGLRASGASTLLARQKSLAIFLRTGYGAGESRYPFFPENSVHTYKSLSIRNSGQDRDKARMRDSLFAKAVQGLSIETIQTRVCVAYINGQYWGIYDLNENQNEDFLASHYGADPDAVDIIRRNETRLAGDKYEFKRVRAYALNTDLSDDAKYAEFMQWVDEAYFTDYLIAQSFFANGDMFNQKYWRAQDYSIKWRPVFFDLDLGFSASNPSRNILPSYFKSEGVPSQDGSLTNMDIYCGLRKNADWCDRFCARYVSVVENSLTAERLTALVDAMQAELSLEMERHIAKWGDPSSKSAWEKQVKALRDCLAQRADYALKNLQKEFDLSDAQMQAYKDAARTAAPAVDAA